MAQNPVQYAEGVLGVHAVYADSLDRLDSYEVAVQAGVDARHRVKARKDALDQRELEVIADRRSERHEMSATAFKTALKEWLAADEQYQRLLDELHEAEFDRDQADADARIHEHGVRVHTARMEELAGLLNFYAAAKQADTSSKSNTSNTTITGEPK